MKTAWFIVRNEGKASEQHYNQPGDRFDRPGAGTAFETYEAAAYYQPRDPLIQTRIIEILMPEDEQDDMNFEDTGDADNIEVAPLSTALDRLRAFRATFNVGEPVDEESGLTADDLTTLIEAIEAFGEDAVAQDPQSQP